MLRGRGRPEPGFFLAVVHISNLNFLQPLKKLLWQITTNFQRRARGADQKGPAPQPTVKAVVMTRSLSCLQWSAPAPGFWNPFGSDSRQNIFFVISLSDALLRAEKIKFRKVGSSYRQKPGSERPRLRNTWACWAWPIYISMTHLVEMTGTSCFISSMSLFSLTYLYVWLTW